MTGTTYTDFVASLSDDGNPPDRRYVEAVCGRLRQDLVRQIRKRGLWDAPPSYFGTTATTWLDGDGLDELVQASYQFIFLERLVGIRIQLRKRADVDGLVVLNLRHLLARLQRRADPIGARVFRMLRSAVLAAVDARALHVLDGDPDVRNDTVLGFDPDTPADRTIAELAEHVRTWNDGLLPELITATGGAVVGIVARLTARIVDLADAGVEAFRFRDLIDPMKRDVRRRWQALWEISLGELAPEHGDEDSPTVKVPVDRPREIDDPREIERLVEAVSSAIDGLPAHQTRDRTTRDYLAKLWTFVRETTLTDDAPDAPRRPSDRLLGQRLGIPRKRLPELFDRLGGLVRECGARLGRPWAAG